MDLTLVARTPIELQSAHTQMVAWCDQKVAEIEDEVRALTASMNAAVEANFRVDAFDRHLRVAERRLTFYAKVKAALYAGYFIVPNFPMDVFAIRTSWAKPRGKTTDKYWDRMIQPCEQLPIGAGRYVSPAPTRTHRTSVGPDEKGQQKTFHQYRPADFEDVEFPVKLAEPAVLTAVGAAFVTKLFDEIGVARDAARCGDPMILGRIRNPRVHRPSVTCFIAWWFQPERL